MVTKTGFESQKQSKGGDDEYHNDDDSKISDESYRV
jgi:hypothetical protein